MRQLSNIPYIAALALVTTIMLLLYAAVQQSYRTNANDPQIQIARDMAARLEQNRSIATIFPADTIDLSESMAVFANLYNADKQPVKASGFLNNAIPRPPDGVLENAKANRENWITWQPQKDVRVAAIVKYVNAPSISYIVVGRSLQEVEIREANLVKMVMACWISCIIIIAAAWSWNFYRSKPTNL